MESQFETSKRSKIIFYLWMIYKCNLVRLWETTCWTASRLKDLISMF